MVERVSEALWLLADYTDMHETDTVIYKSSFVAALAYEYIARSRRRHTSTLVYMKVPGERGDTFFAQN